MTIQNRQPAFRLYTVKGKDDAARWTEIGAAWSNQDGNGFTLNLDALPIDGRIVMRAIVSPSDNGGQK